MEQNLTHLSVLKTNNLFRILELRNKMHNNQANQQIREAQSCFCQEQLLKPLFCVYIVVYDHCRT